MLEAGHVLHGADGLRRGICRGRGALLVEEVADGSVPAHIVDAAVEDLFVAEVVGHVFDGGMGFELGLQALRKICERGCNEASEDMVEGCDLCTCKVS